MTDKEWEDYDKGFEAAMRSEDFNEDASKFWKRGWYDAWKERANDGGI